MFRLHGCGLLFGCVMADQSSVTIRNKVIAIFMVIHGLFQAECNALFHVCWGQLLGHPLCWHLPVSKNVVDDLVSSLVVVVIGALGHSACSCPIPSSSATSSTVIRRFALIMSSTFLTFSSLVAMRVRSGPVCPAVADAHHWIYGTISASFASTTHLAHTYQKGGYEFLCLILHVPIHSRKQLSLLSLTTVPKWTSSPYLQEKAKRLVSALHRHCNSSICLIVVGLQPLVYWCLACVHSSAVSSFAHSRSTLLLYATPWFFPGWVLEAYNNSTHSRQGKFIFQLALVYTNTTL